MSSKTPYYALHKADLNDAPPDITVFNENWDILDGVLKNIIKGTYIDVTNGGDNITNINVVLNELKETNNYTFLAPATNPFGAAEGALFTLVVDMSNYGGKPSTVQTATQTYAADGELPRGATFRRTYYEIDGWSEWTNVSKTTAIEIGAVPAENVKSSAYDMDVILKSGAHYGMYETNVDTLGTPLKYGVTHLTAALILSFANSNLYGIQYAFMSGGLVFTRTMTNGTINPWTTGFLPLTGGKMTGSLEFNNLNDYYVLTKGRTLTDGKTHFMTMGMSHGGSVSLEHYHSDNTDFTSATIDGRLELRSVPNNPDALVIREDNQTGKVYKMYGEHNVTKGTSDLIAGTSPLADGCIYLVYE